VGLEVLFESCVQQFDLEWGSIWQPISKEQLAAVHPIAVGVLKIEHAHSGFLGRKRLYEVRPIPLSFSGFLQHLYRGGVTTFSLSTL